ncbi:MAG TPA: arylesterase [Xanthobacteraceae bacterium]|nr:arylesterase [Xanthobacteraceae bacterium]
MAAEPLRIVAFGDSLTAGLGLSEKDAFPVKLEAALKAKGHDVEVINAGVSGDTASGGLARLDWSVPDKVDAVILELGANDALRGTEPAATRKALDDTIRRLKSRDIPVLLAGMQAPRNMGPDYIAAFDRIYPELAAEHGVLFYPFFLDGVAAQSQFNQRDGIHPTADGVDVIVRGILPYVEKLIAEARANRKN